MKNFLPVTISCLLAGGAIGYVAGSQSDNSADSAGENSAGSSSTVSSRSSRTQSRSNNEEAKRASSLSYRDAVSQPGQTNRIQALVDFYANLSPEEYAAEADKLRDLPFSEQMLHGYLLFSAWAENSPYDAMSHANNNMGRTGAFVRPTILQSWAATDPVGAAQYFEGNKSEFAMMSMMGRGRGGMSGAETIAAEWAKTDPDAALEWAKTLDGREGAQATAQAISEIASTDPERAASLAIGLEGEALTSANETIAAEWAKTDWNAAESFINGLPADQQSQALASAINSIASTDPELAASKALLLPEGNSRDNAVETVAEAMARENPAEAAAWLTENGSEDAREGALRDVIQNWVNVDAEAARSYALEQPEGELRDEAISSYVRSDSNITPQEGVELAEGISDDRTRTRTIARTTFEWMAEDSAAATEYIESSTAVSDEMKERLLNNEGGRGFRRGGGRGR